MFCAWALFVIFTFASEVGKEKACKCKVWPKNFQALALGIWLPALLHPKFLEKF